MLIAVTGNWFAGAYDGLITLALGEYDGNFTASTPNLTIRPWVNPDRS